MSSAAGSTTSVGPWPPPRRGAVAPRAVPEVRARVVSRLCGLRAAGELSAGHVRQAAAGAGVSERTVYRWLREGPQAGRPGPPPTGLDEANWQAFEDFRGNIAAVHRARAAVVAGRDTAAGVPISDELRQGWATAEPMSLRTLQAAFARALRPVDRAAWTGGEQARRQAQISSPRAAPHRNACWQADHTELDIVVLPPRGPACRPWLTSFHDESSRVVMGWCLALYPDAGTVLAALRMSLLVDPDRGPHGGVPAVLAYDGGLEFAAAAVRAVCDSLVIEVQPSPPYTPHHHGLIERWHRTIDQTLCCQLPGYTGGPRTAAGDLYGPIRDDTAWRASAADSPQGARPLTISTFTRIFTDWVRWYNTDHAHAGLDGASPLQVWNDDPSPITIIEAGKLRDLLLAGIDRTISHAGGIRFRNLTYTAPELYGRVGQRVQVRYAPHNDRFVEVYQDGAHLTTAYPRDAMSPEQAEAYRTAWATEGKRLATRRRAATRRARRRLEVLDEDTSTAETRLVPTDAATPPGAVVVQGSASLLGLADHRSRPRVLDPHGNPTVPDTPE
jgi:putative transposase